MTKKLPNHEKINRKPISRACTFCHKKHLQCDPGRPCKNCIKRGLQDSCRNVERKRAKYLVDDKSNSVSSRASIEVEPINQFPLPNISPHIELSHPSTISNITSTAPIRQISDISNQKPHSWDPTVASSRSSNNLLKPDPVILNSNDSEVFSSTFFNQEYSQLSDILENNNIIPSSPSQNSVINYNNPEFRTAFQSDNNTRPYISLSDNSTNITNNISDLALNSEHTEGYTSPLILRHLIKTPEDVYKTQITSYNYPKAYSALLDYLRERFKKEQLYQIAETMAAYRPSFIAATRSLVEMDLLFAERSFQRSLLEYESMSALCSSPTVMWRRTGEIVAVSTEFSSLTSHTKTELLSKRTFIIEIMSDSSALEYFKKFSYLAFGEINAVVIQDCTLIGPSGEDIRCASTWTVKRDVFDIPMLIVGQFLPILHVR
ncbi:hypothetical protein WICMUC_001567 [Wickerhamomyces mucosus]|uniref:Glucose starvation modulator protein 1 n=1 Tax=Wickerhamomyces mucosus TaxID=1378264 RepID=A0A9P8TGW0_9ASCO|nr:hypothetical protein WICMUC_001567 [Wickerhamomyces mucosus]